MSSTHEPTCGHQSLISIPALAPFVKADLKRIERSANVKLGLVLQEHPQVAGQLVLEGVGKRRLGDRLARVAIQGGLGIEALDVAGAADHEQPDDILGLGGEVRPPVGRLPAGCLVVIGPGKAVAMQHRCQSQRRETPCPSR